MRDERDCPSEINARTPTARKGTPSAKNRSGSPATQYAAATIMHSTTAVPMSRPARMSVSTTAAASPPGTMMRLSVVSSRRKVDSTIPRYSASPSLAISEGCSVTPPSRIQLRLPPDDTPAAMTTTRRPTAVARIKGVTRFHHVTLWREPIAKATSPTASAATWIRNSVHGLPSSCRMENTDDEDSTTARPTSTRIEVAATSK